MTEKELDKLVIKAYQQIVEEEYKEDIKKMQELEKNPNEKIQFSKKHEKKMRKLFRDVAKGKIPS